MQHSWQFQAEAFEEEAHKLLEGTGPLPAPLDAPQDLGYGFRHSDLMDEARARALRAAEQEYHGYRERAKGPTTPGLAANKAQWDAWETKRSADTAAWLKSRPRAADFQAQQSPLRAALGPLRGDLLAAESQSNVLHATASKLLPDLAPLIGLWGIVQHATIVLSTPDRGPGMEQDPPRAGAAAALLKKEPLRQEAAAAMTAFGAALPALGQEVLHDQPALGRDPLLEHLQRTSADLAAQLRTAYTPQHLAGFAPRFRELTDILDRYLARRLRAQQKQGGAHADELGRTADELAHFSGRAANLARLREDHPDAERVPAVFYAEREFENVGEPGAPQFQAKGIPWVFYLAHAQTEFGGQPITLWELVDLTSPRNIKTNTQGSGTPTSGDKPTPPDALFAQLNSTLRFPKGELWLQLPNGQHRRIITTAPWRLSEFLQWIGIALSLAALAVATGGVSVPATVIVVGGGAVMAAGAVADLAEKSKQGMLTTQDIVVDALTLAGGLAAAEQGLGKFVVAKSLQADARFAALARLHGRLAAPIGTVGHVANTVSLAIMAGDLWHEFAELGKITDEQERKLAQGRLVSNLLLSGALQIVALGQGMRERLAGTEPRPPSGTPPGTTEPTTTATGSSQTGSGGASGGEVVSEGELAPHGGTSEGRAATRQAEPQPGEVLAPEDASLLATDAKAGFPPSPETIRDGTVRMEEHPAYAQIVAKLKEQGFALRFVQRGEPRVVVLEIVDAQGKVIRVEKYVNVWKGMRFVDLEHEVGHVNQITQRFGDTTPVIERWTQMPDGSLTKIPNAPGLLTGWQNRILEYHNRIAEFNRLAARGVSREVLVGEARGIAEWRSQYWKGMKGERSPSRVNWRDTHVPDLPAMENEYELRHGPDYEKEAAKQKAAKQK